MRTLWTVIRTAAQGFVDHDAFTLAAALAFYTLLSLAPLVVFLVVAVGAIDAQGQQYVIHSFQATLGPRAARTVGVILQNAATYRRLGSFSSVISAIVLFLGATGMFGQLQSGLNRIWEVRLRPGFRLGEWLRRRGMIFLMVIVLGAILLASLLLSTAVRFLLPAAPGWVAQAGTLAEVVMITVLFAALYRYLPDAVLDWRDVWNGALLTALLLALGHYGIVTYFRYSTIALSYGVAASLLVLLLSLYYSAAMVYLGAELTQVWAQTAGHPIRPRDYAEWTKPHPGPMLPR